MWPSMVQASPSTVRASMRTLVKPSISSSIGVNDSQVDRDFEALKSTSEGMPNMEKEMDMLAKWLEDDSDDEKLGNSGPVERASKAVSGADDPWATGGRDSPSSNANSTAKHDTHSRKEGFDDDFTDFISAPAASTQQQRRTHNIVPSSASPSETFKWDSDLDDDDDLLPPLSEIQAASARIFFNSSSYDPSNFTRLPDSPSDLIPPQLQSTHEDGPSTPQQEQNQDQVRAHGQGRNLEEATINPDSDSSSPMTFETPASSFDLSRVLSALEGMKDEVAQIEDEGERRRAAARVALGLVYGLEGNTMGSG
jgi:hypothetical protein